MKIGFFVFMFITSFSISYTVSNIYSNYFGSEYIDEDINYIQYLLEEYFLTDEEIEVIEI